MRAFSALSNRSFALLWSGQTLSRLGDSLFTIALAWWVLQKTGSATAMGIVLICSTLPMLLLLLFGGVAVDRFPRLHLMLASLLIDSAHPRFLFLVERLLLV
jgi:MFS family permease